MDTTKLRELQALAPSDFVYHRDKIVENALEAADTIERQDEEIARLKSELNDRSDEMKTRRSEAFFSGYVASKQAR